MWQEDAETRREPPLKQVIRETCPDGRTEGTNRGWYPKLASGGGRRLTCGHVLPTLSGSSRLFDVRMPHNEGLPPVPSLFSESQNPMINESELWSMMVRMVVLPDWGGGGTNSTSPHIFLHILYKWRPQNSLKNSDNPVGTRMACESLVELFLTFLVKLLINKLHFNIRYF